MHRAFQVARIVKYAAIAGLAVVGGLTALITFMERNEEPYDR